MCATIRQRPPATRSARHEWHAATTLVVAGCADANRVPPPDPPSAAGTIAVQPHTQFDVLFARDIIDHSA
ncbi:hypothetical protein MDOR_18790 [Mycolicibacterium doricum]|uniref:Uncharacterized protein n=2 Tax=Mycolicibacterium TaxID=1866885 RepID=A0A7I7VRT2_9MYCO|nr:hypothetical protein [Mycolicibacterium monacense DSM 44395]BBZ07710.1 hypothetical protein MDOR_18790 [Mycolicibacterium doricum]BBZ60744.1 hypothetical protein MMON_20450 [Mycolicibacterium monacense]